MEHLIGEKLGNYQILDELGRGGMARVYRARQINLDRECALKLLRPELAEDESFIDRFLREARAVARLDHPNIVPVYDTGRIGPYHYLAMKLLDGSTLAHILRSGRLDLHHVAAYVGQAASALGYAHQQGVVHRDVKPGNIMVDERGWLTITDFGLARLSQELRTTMTGTLLGTPAYMAPEQVSGDPVTPQTDIYQLGVVTYEMLTGSTPFGGRAQHAMLLAHLQEQPAPLYELNEALTTDIDLVVQRVLAKSPAERYQAVSEFSEDFVRAVVAALPAGEQGERLGPYDVAMLPTVASWSDVGHTPFRISTDPIDVAQSEDVVSPASSSVESIAAPPDEQAHAAERTTSRRVGDGEVVEPAGLSGDGGAAVPPTAHGSSSGASRRYWIAGGATLAVIAALVVASFQLGFVGGAGAGDESSSTATPAVLAGGSSGDATATPTATSPDTPATPSEVVADPATSTPDSTKVEEPALPPSPTATPMATPAPRPTRTPIVIYTPTPIPDEADEPATPDAMPSEAHTLLDTNFHDWYIGPLDNGEIFLADGGYHLLESSGGGRWVLAYSISEQPFTDFSVSVDLRRISGAPNAQACVLARVDGANQQYDYALCINGEGGVSAFFEQFSVDGEYTADPLLPANEFAVSPPDSWTTLKIIARGDEFWFLVNGEPAGSFQHSGPDAGEVGVIVNNFGDSPAQYEFINLVVRALE